jgi:hypothetical protein
LLCGSSWPDFCVLPCFTIFTSTGRTINLFARVTELQKQTRTLHPLVMSQLDMATNSLGRDEGSEDGPSEKNVSPSKLGIDIC